MPTISMFYGISILMFTNNEHNPPHFHAVYQNYKASFYLDGSLKEGNLPPKHIKFIKAWATIHKDELEVNWQLAMAKQALYKIDPLK